MSGQTHYRPRYPHTIAEEAQIEDYIRTHPGCSSADVAMYLGRPGQAGGVRVRRSGPWLRRLDIWAKENGGAPDPSPGPGSEEGAPTDQGLAERDLESRIVEVLRRGPQALNDLAAIVKSPRGHVLDVIDSLLRHGVNVRQAGDHFSLEGLPDVGTNSREPVVFLSTTDSTFKFGIISDTHVGSKYARPDVVAALYRAFAAEGVKAVFHAGNMIEGESTFNRYDLDVYGMDRQIEALVKGWPRYPGITTYAVHGDDHEGWYGKSLGLDMGKAIETAFRDAGRDDWVDLGFMEADVLLKNAITGSVASVRVTHPGGGSCFDDKAEVLTRDKGWIPFADLALTDQIATMTKGGHEFQWQNPTKITNEPYSGDMVEIKSRGVHCRVTPTHRFWVRTGRDKASEAQPLTYPQKAYGRKTREWRAVTAGEIEETFSRQKYLFPLAPSGWVGNYTPTVTIPYLAPVCPGNRRNANQMQHMGTQRVEDVAELIGWYVSEGYAHKKGVVISQSPRVHPENHGRICALLSRMGIRYGVPGPLHKDIVVGSTELSRYLDAECGSRSRHVHLPPWLKDQPRSVLQIVLHTMLLGDGWRNGDAFGYRSLSPRLLTDVVEIAQKLGHGCSFHGDGDTVGIYAPGHTDVSLNERPTRAPYDGRVYCCSVPNELILVRSNKKQVFWSHNSYALSYACQKLIESFSGGEKPAAVILGHYHKMGVFHYRNVWAILAGTTKDQDVFMRKKRLAAHVGGVIVDFTQDPATGALVGCRVDMRQFFDAGYYNERNGRWSQATGVVHPTMTAVPTEKPKAAPKPTRAKRHKPRIPPV